MSDILKVAAVSIAATLCCIVLRKRAPELALALAITAGPVILWQIASSLEYVTAFLEFLSETAGISPAVTAPVLKVTGISLVTKTAGELCRDAGEGGIASFLDLAGTVMALVVTIPLAQAVIQSVAELI